ncbi:hypothetical protein ACIRQQ_15850 [Streptomyces fuscichromogenes]|uniref:hypothetical protein n=1 Tax=Streptomyces fuscichromogenes TaxID=1324013 RepID=UPI00381D3374
MGNSGAKAEQGILDEANAAARALSRARPDQLERAIADARGACDRMLESVTSAGFTGPRLARVQEAHRTFLSAILEKAQLLDRIRAEARAAQERRAVEAADPERRLQLVASALKKIGPQQQSMEETWLTTLKPGTGLNRHGVPTEDAQVEYEARPDVAALTARRAALQRLLGSLEGWRGLTRAEQLERMSAEQFQDVFDRARAGKAVDVRYLNVERAPVVVDPNGERAEARTRVEMAQEVLQEAWTAGARSTADQSGLVAGTIEDIAALSTQQADFNKREIKPRIRGLVTTAADLGYDIGNVNVRRALFDIALARASAESNSLAGSKQGDLGLLGGSAEAGRRVPQIRENTR